MQFCNSDGRPNVLAAGIGFVLDAALGLELVLDIGYEHGYGHGQGLEMAAGPPLRVPEACKQEQRVG